MRTIQLAASLLLGTMIMVGCAENSPTELTDTSAFAEGPPDPLPGPPEFIGPPGEVCVPFESLVGTWTLTGFTEDGVEVVLDGTNFEFTFSSDGTFLESVTGDTRGLICDTGTSCTDDGRYIQTDVNFLICDPHCDHIQDYTISGNTLTISFDGGEEQSHTPFTSTFVRTSASGPPLCGPVESLVGEWTATSFTFEGEADLVPPLSLKFIFFSNGTFTQVVVDAPPETFCDGTSCGDGGRYIQTDVNLLTCDPHCDHIQDYTISGNTLTISFDGGEEQSHTPFTATFVKTPGKGVTHQATGSGVRAGSIRHLRFSAIAMADGSVSGQYNLTFEGGIFRLQAEVTCLRVVGNQAWIGGVIKSSTNPARVGREGGFVVEDNGDGGGAPPDRVSLMFTNLGPGGAAAVCAGDTGIDGTLRDIDEGNVQVH